MSYARLAEPPLPPLPRRAPVESIPMKSFFLRPADASHKRPPMTPTRRRKLLLSYAPDWIITIVLAALFFSLDKVEGYRRVFSLEDTSLRHPYALHERVPNIALYFICFVAPLFLQPVINFITIRSWWDLHNSTLGLILGLSITGAVTQFTKITVGRPRPDVIDRCQPPNGAIDPPFKLTSSTICTQLDASILRDGFRSFPSGHSSLSFAGLGFLAFYIAGKLHLFDRRGHAGKAWLSLSPFAAAALVAISRTMDYRHHWHDVLVGSILGTFVSYFTYRQYYPSLASELSHRPYSPRIKREDIDTLPIHHPAQSSSTDLHQPEILQAHQHQPYNNPFTSPPVPLHNELHPDTYPPRRYTDHSRDPSRDYELEGTVMRPGPTSLEEVWKDGEGQHSIPRGVPATRSVSAITPEPRQGSSMRDGPTLERSNTAV